MATKQFGIDVSKYEKGLDLSRARDQGVKFVIARAAYHLTADSSFEGFYKSAGSLGLPFGAYVYTMADNAKEAESEADNLLKILDGKRLALPVYIDIEHDKYRSNSKSMNTGIVTAFCERMEKKGWFAGFYASKSFIDECLDDSKLKKYTHWVAQWGKSCTYGDSSCLGMWQFGGETNELRSNKVAGMVCDQDYMLTGFPTIIKNGGFNGYGKTGNSGNTEPALPDCGYMKQGDSGAGVYLLKKDIEVLKYAGVVIAGTDDNDIFGEGTAAAVRQIQTSAGITADGKVGAKTIRAIAELLKKEIKKK
ncbi:MAG: peptidoglycan-binding protein [Clostridia bacterium]|nr:peptidoglycan-binding protein [Clostridia bacterium]